MIFGGNLFRKRKSAPEPVFNVDSFGQEGEDAVLARLLVPYSGKSGFFMDVGAHHPIRFSNTWKFYQQGWRGINIDPTPGSMAAFKETRPEDINLELAISSEEGSRKFYCYNEPALNGIDNDRTEELRDTRYRLESVVDVPTRSLSSVLDNHAGNFSSPNFLTIDVEGHESEVLLSNDWERWRFDFLLVEQRLEHLGLLRESEIWKLLNGFGYQAVACTGRTVIYQTRPTENA